jgi:outer membrane immunogenic protein
MGISMKRLAFAFAFGLAASSAAMAADIPPPPPPPHAPAAYIPVPPPYNWSGFYVGGNLGVGWNGGGSVSDTAGSTFTLPSTNTQFLAGGQVGVNYEFWGGVVIGAEAMFDWLPNTSNTVTVTNGADTASLNINNRWLTTATGKLGYAWDRVLLYGKGGGAWVGTNNPGLTIDGAPSNFTSSQNNNNFGWTAGLGVEWAFYGGFSGWSARAEWDYIRLQNQTYTVAATAPAFANDAISVNNRNINMFTVGVNYKFGGKGPY